MISATSGSLIAALVVTVALVSGGYPSQRLDLNDASVWVANGTKQLIGRANTLIQELNTVVPSQSSEIEVVQSGATVLLFDQSNSKVDVVDPVTSTIIDTVPLPTDSPRLFIAGSNVVVTDGDGEVWIVPSNEFEHFDPESQPTLSLGGDCVYSMDAAGSLGAYSQAAGIVYRIDAAHDLVVEASHEFAFGGPASVISVSWVGSHWSLFDETTRTIVVDGNSTELASEIPATERPKLQNPSANGQQVLLATGSQLLGIPFDGTSPQSLVTGMSGNPAPPLIYEGCTFGAWSGGVAWRDCQNDGEGIQFNIASMPQGAVRLTFAANGDRVVLNDPRGGGVWAVQSRGELIDNWDELVTVNQEQQEIREDNLDTPPVPEKVQQPPVAIDDEFGARPSASTVLPVLLNDYDQNGDVLVVSQFTQIDEAIGRLDLVNNAQQVQLTLGQNATGTITFGYTVTDGRGGEASARVTVSVRAASENSPPVQVRKSKTLVAQGGRVTALVLGDWVDPDGDSIYLEEATTAAPDVVSFRPEGSVVFIEGGAASTLRSVGLVVTDGSAAGSGSLAITVGLPGQVPIVAEPFVVLSYAGQDVTVRPLEHVRGGTGTLRLSSVPAKTSAEITTNIDSGSFRFRSNQVRTFILEYVVTDGDQTVTGMLRVDVASPPDANAKPITVPKTVFIKSLSSATVDIATSDIDPAGGVLLVTGVTNVPEFAGLQAEIIEQRAIRVTLTAPQDDGPVRFNYLVSNGLAQAEGVITVIEIPRPIRLQPPIATDDSISVRVGAAIDIPVLDNDVQPDGEELTLNPQLTSALGSDSGLLFASGNILRYLAPDKPGNFTASYEVSGPDGQSTQAAVRISVRESVEATNNAPIPVTVVARVLAGESVNIRIPLSGIDTDGDSVQLLGQETNPEKGAVVRIGSDSLQYEAGDYSAGTDSFTYTVIDSLGARATGTVRVGISQKSQGARNPVATPDDVSMRPGGSVTIQVLANDSDPDGSPLTVTSVASNPTNSAVTASTDGTVVTVTPPNVEGQYGLIYSIQNEFGGTSSNFITVTVSHEAPRAYPIANDTVLTLTDILDRTTIDVNVLANVFFADGSVSQLGVSLLPGYRQTASLTSDKRISVTVGNQRQIIPFAVSNPHDPEIVSYAFLWVPGYDDALPQTNRKARPLVVASESTLIIPLNDYVIAIGGKKVRLTDTTTVRATHSNGSSLVVDNQNLRFTSADKYFGPASISFEVTDGASSDDPDGRKATLVLPITVTPRENQPPVFNGGVIDFEPGEVKVLDLLKLTSYPYPDDIDELAYTALAPLPVNFSYTLTGQSLTIRANEDAAKGSTTSLVLGVRDDLTTGKSGSIQLSVVASSRPLAKPAADTAIAPRGKTTIVDVLANDEATNPFPGVPMRVLGIRGIDGASLPAGVTINPSADFSKLSVTVTDEAPAQDINLQYQVSDATKDLDRFVWGSVTIKIQDAPDPVTGVQVTGFSDRQVTVAWSPGAFNNSPITGYEVTATRVDTGSVFGVTRCTVTNGCAVPTPGNGPSFSMRISVVAINSIGPSESTTIGQQVWSDILPAAPATVTAIPTNAAPAGGAVSVSWSVVSDPPGGSPILGYTVQITGPGVDSSLLIPAGVTAYDFSNSAGLLIPGVQYSVTVFARNSAQVNGAGEWIRNPGVPVMAIGPPSQTSGGVTGVVINPQGHIQISWGPSDPKGAPGVSYTVGRFLADAVIPTQCQAPTPGTGAGSFSSGWVDDDVQDQQSYRYVVYADNGFYCTPTASGAIITMRPPGQATATVDLQPHDGQFDLRVSNLAVTSLTAAKFQAQLNGDGNWFDVGEGYWLTSSANLAVYGNPVTVTVRGCRDAEGVFCGEASASATLTPVNARASIVSCVIGAQAVPNPPLNANNPTVEYEYSFNDGGLAGSWSAFSPDETVPTPAVLGSGIVMIRVKAAVTFVAPTTYTDPGFTEGTCSP